MHLSTVLGGKAPFDLTSLFKQLYKESVQQLTMFNTCPWSPAQEPNDGVTDRSGIKPVIFQTLESGKKNNDVMFADGSS